MWMLYGGGDKCGGMIDFTKKGIHSILDTQEIELGYFDDQGKFVSCAALMRTEFDIWITDIVYYSENKRYFCLKRSDESCYTVSKSVMDGLIMCKKAYPWNYENECRLIVSISRQILQQIYNFGDCDTVKLNLQGMNLGKSFKRIYKSPNYPLNDNTGVLASNIDQTVDWNICKDHCRLSGGE